MSSRKADFQRTLFLGTNAYHIIPWCEARAAKRPTIVSLQSLKEKIAADLVCHRCLRRMRLEKG